MSHATRVAEVTGRTLFDVAQEARDEALAAVAEHSDPDWRDEAYEFLTRFLEAHQFMHVDDLWAAGLPEPTEMRALGPLMQRAARNGLMVRTGQSRPSVRSHLSEKPVWRSLICRETS